MKKFLATVLALSCATVLLLSTAMAKDLVPTSSDAGNAIEDLETMLPMDQPDAKITVVVKMTDPEHYGWGLGNFGANVNGTWTDSKLAAGGEIMAADENEASFTYTIKELIESFGATDASEIANLKFGTWNGGALVKIVVAEAGAAPADPAPEGDKAPQTGDVMNVVVLAALAVVALGGVVVCANKKNA